MTNLEIRVDDLSGKPIAELLLEHHQDMLKHSPVESVHTLDLESLRASEITFWTGWIDNQLAGCGALKELDQLNVEIKSMRTSRSALRRGVASTLLSHLLEEAKCRGYSTVWLETGSPSVFIPARKLYLQFGFEYCEPFADYVEDPYSLFMSKAL